MKILLLADIRGWIVERCVKEMERRLPFDCTTMYYTDLDGKRLKELSKEYELIYYSNWDIKYCMPELEDLDCPLIISCRSHRYPKEFKDFYERNKISTKIFFHVLTTELSVEFPQAYVIPDGIDDKFFRRDFVVGFAGRPCDYKGFDTIKKACSDMGYTFKPATETKYEDMIDYYKSLDVLVCFSENEAFNTPVMECLALNIPVLTTNVGIPRLIQCPKTDRTIDDLKRNLAIIKNKRTVNLVEDYTWEKITKLFTDLFNYICKN